MTPTKVERRTVGLRFGLSNSATVLANSASVSRGGPRAIESGFLLDNMCRSEVEMTRRSLLGIILCTGFLAVAASGQGNKKIPASQAGQHIGENATVCGVVASSRYLSTSRSKPTFLNLGKPYPNEDFTVVIWPDDRSKFGHPEDSYLHKNICVSGEISSYKGTPQIIARNPSQIHEE